MIFEQIQNFDQNYHFFNELVNQSHVFTKQ